MLNLKKVISYNYNNKFLDKDLLSDIRSFIMIEYQSLKLESQNHKTKETINNLFYLLKKYDKDIDIKYIQNSICKSTNPVELLKILTK